MRRHLKIAAGAELEIPQKQWEKLMRAITGHIKIGSNATVRVVPEPPKEHSHEEARRA